MNALAKILVVDDEKQICQNVEKILKKNHFEVIHAQSAKEALEKMAKETFSLLISDIVMPEMNGLELLRLVKDQWPLTKALMMTAYASTDTAVKAIRLGALDYLPKPFTPDELRTKVSSVLTGEIEAVQSSKEERHAINLIDLDIPYDADEVAKVTGEDYVRTLGPSDMPIVEVPTLEALENYCKVGDMVCDIYKKLGTTCKIGLKKNACPQLAKKAKAAKTEKQDTKSFIGIDYPFSYEEVISVTGPEYVQNLQYEGVAFLPYEELKRNMQKEMKSARAKIDEDMPFDADEVAKVTGDEYVKTLGPSDMTAKEAPHLADLEGYCKIGNMVCDIYKKLGNTCKGGLKKSACPQLAKKAKKVSSAGVDVRTLIGIDQPFDYKEVAAVTGPEYAMNMDINGMSVMPYEQLKASMEKELQKDWTDASVTDKVQPVLKQILVIDDEVAVNNNIRKILTKKGFEVDQAVTKKDALAKIGEARYQLILLDLKIPGVKGLELLKAVRDTQPEAKVIIITGYASIETAVETARMGAIDYLPKPFTPDEIRAKADYAFALAA